MELLLFLALAVAIVALNRALDARSARADARRRNRARPWR